MFLSKIIPYIGKSKYLHRDWLCNYYKAITSEIQYRSTRKVSWFLIEKVAVKKLNKTKLVDWERAIKVDSHLVFSLFHLTLNWIFFPFVCSVLSTNIQIFTYAVSNWLLLRTSVFRLHLWWQIFCKQLHKQKIECFVFRECHAPRMKRLPATASYEHELVRSVQRIISESIKHILF